MLVKDRYIVLYVYVCAADSMDSSSKQFVSVDDVAVMNGDTSAGKVHCLHCISSITRMVQLSATSAIEYVAACWVSGAGWIFVRGAFLRRVLCPFPPKFNAYTHRLGFLCLAS